MARRAFIYSIALLTSVTTGSASADTTLQQPLRDGYQEPFEAVLEITNHDYSTYTTTIAVGDPPQNFTAIIDTTWSDAWLPSVDCPQRSHQFVCDAHPLYNGTASRTYVRSNQSVALNNSGFWTSGRKAADTYHIRPLQASGQSFVEASDVRPSFFFHHTWYDTVLPLARITSPVNIFSNLSASSVFQNLQAQGNLARNVISIRLPPTEHEVGELCLGGVDPDFANGNDIARRLPMVKGPPDPGYISTRWIAGGWYVEPISVTLEAEPNPVSFNLSGHVAVLNVAEPYILLPDDFVRAMHTRLGSNSMELPCNRTAGLPDLTFRLRGEAGQVHSFTLHGEDYLRAEPQVPFTAPGICNIFATAYSRLPDNTPPFIVLGSLFLRKFHTVFDADEMLVSFTCPACIS